MEGTSSSSKPKKEKLSDEARKEKLIQSFKEVIFTGKNPRLELYKVIIDEIHGDETTVDKIDASSSLCEEIIYQRKQGEKIPIGKPIWLSPSRPPSCIDPVEIFIGPSDWCWGYTYGPYHRFPDDLIPRCKQFTAFNGSKTKIFYQRISRSVEAEIQISFGYECEVPLGVQIQGEIFATTEGNLDTKRVLLCLDEGTSLKSDAPLKLDRSVVALSLNSVLNISFDLTLADCDRKYTLSLDDLQFEVPAGLKEDSREVPVKVSDLMQKKLIREEDYEGDCNTIAAGILEDFKIKIKVSWSNDMTHYYDYEEMVEFDISSGSEEEDEGEGDEGSER